MSLKPTSSLHASLLDLWRIYTTFSQQFQQQAVLANLKPGIRGVATFPGMHSALGSILIATWDGREIFRLRVMTH